VRKRSEGEKDKVTPKVQEEQSENTGEGGKVNHRGFQGKQGDRRIWIKKGEDNGATVGITSFKKGRGKKKNQDGLRDLILLPELLKGGKGNPPLRVKMLVSRLRGKASLLWGGRKFQKKKKELKTL